MTNRKLAFIVKNQKPLVCPAHETVGGACRAMRESFSGSMLVVDTQQRLCGIFTGRDAVRLLAKGGDAASTPVVDAMTSNPVTISPESRAIDALRAMSDGGFRHVPLTEDGRICGVVSRSDLKGMEFEEFLWPSTSRMTGLGANREIAQIIEGRTPLVLEQDAAVQMACGLMVDKRAGSTLVADSHQHLAGIFTGRDAVRALAQNKGPADLLADVMTRAPETISPASHAVDALRAMNDGGFRHLPVVENGKIVGLVSRADFTGAEIDRLDEEEHLKECIW